MNPKTRAKIQEALDDTTNFIETFICQCDPETGNAPCARCYIVNRNRAVLAALAAEPDEPTVSGYALEIAHNVAGKRGVDIANEIQMFAERYAASKQSTAIKSVEELVEKLNDMAWWEPGDCGINKKQAIPTIQQFLDAQIAERDKRIEELENIAKRTKQFIVNGVELGYIRMPDKDTLDAALTLLPQIEKALSGRRGTP